MTDPAPADPTPPAAAAARSVMIATPTVEGRVVVPYLKAVVETQAALLAAGIRPVFRFDINASLLAAVRNSAVADFLEGEADDLLFLDADMSWQAADVLRLLSYDAPLVAAAYRAKVERVHYTVEFEDPAAVAVDRATGLLVAARVGTGFMRLRRDCLTRMVEAYPGLRAFDGTRGAEVSCLFDTATTGGRFVSEDYTFCDRWRAIGGRILVDPRIAIDHWGLSAYGGRLIDRLTRPG